MNKFKIVAGLYGTFAVVSPCSLEDKALLQSANMEVDLSKYDCFQELEVYHETHTCNSSMCYHADCHEVWIYEVLPSL